MNWSPSSSVTIGMFLESIEDKLHPQSTKGDKWKISSPETSVAKVKKKKQHINVIDFHN